MKSPFRSIRKKLLSEGKLVRYLTYAIGEVLLIIVGIMIALQLNNWNEDRKEQVEFELYIAQLKIDVRDAIDDIESSNEPMEGFLERGENIISFLELSEYQPQDMEKLEVGLNSIGSYNEAQVNVGLLGDLLSGNFEIIGRNRILAREAREMESRVETELENANHVYNQIDLAFDRLNKFRGKGNINLAIPPDFDLEQLKTSDEFRYTTKTILSRIRRIIQISESIIRQLEDFLAVLEEYE